MRKISALDQTKRVYIGRFSFKHHTFPITNLQHPQHNVHIQPSA